MGRATILIKGIAKRLGINWPLAQKWKGMAEAALACGTDGCAMPTWMAVPQPDVLAEATPGRARFREVLMPLTHAVSYTHLTLPTTPYV